MEQERPYAAHCRKDGTVQTIRDHLENVAALAAQFARPFCAEEMAEQCGKAHDLGKYTPGFQRRLYDHGPKVDHSSAGAKKIIAVNKSVSYAAIPAYCIAGHHAGLPDGGGRQDDGALGGTFFARLNKDVKWDEQAFQQDVQLQPLHPPKLTMLGKGGFTISFYTRMLFSCLVDADFLDTEAFMNQQKLRAWAGPGVPELLQKLETYLADKHWLEAAEGLNGQRSQILKTCMQVGRTANKGLFTLTVPTGGGKTVSSLAFALRHAVAKKMQRVIYVIPYCSIIEQTADTFKKILGPENVLAHYSGAQYDDDGEDGAAQRLAAENWDVPVVVTTAVQFFESFFANRTSSCRKLHNAANSVIIFDEAQTLPLPFLKPCIAAIAELVTNYGASCVLCTATQPALAPLFRAYAAALTAQEICPNTEALYQLFRRVRYEQLGELTDEALAQRLNACQQVLCIVSTKKQAKNLFALLKGEGCFHLSTLMIPKHRHAVLETIRQRLKAQLPCRVVSTSLIEAGVDVDFPTVYRAYAGLDSEIQAGGRCNREGRQAAQDSVVYLFQPESIYRVPASMQLPAQEAYSVTREVQDIAAPEVTKAYFTKLYSDISAGLDRGNVVKKFEDGLRNHMSFPFKSVAKQFHLIAEDTWTVLISCDEVSSKLAAQLQQEDFHPSMDVYRQLELYCVSVYTDQFTSWGRP